MNEYLSKPFEPHNLYEKIISVVTVNTVVQEDDNIEGLKALLVEDDLINQKQIMVLMKKWGFELDIADNGKIAIEKLKDNTYDIILMDIRMPEMDGFEAAKFIRTKMDDSVNKIPIIAITASALEEDKHKVYEVGMNEFLSKPFKPDDLFNKIIQLAKKDISVSATSDKTISEGKNISQRNYIDLSYLKKLSDDNTSFMLEIIDTFIEETPEALNKMQIFLKDEDWKSLKAIAHKMKPSVTYIGVKGMDKVIALIEEFAENEINLDKIPELVGHLQTTCDEAIKELKVEKKNIIA